nr:L-aspartate oxidase [Ardenticatena sp.]
MEIIHTPVLVIGSGVAGGITALCLADAGIPVVLATKARDPHECNTFYAQGGIVYRGEDDSPRLLAEDILRAGSHQNRAEAVHLLASEGPTAVERLLLERLNVPFDRTSNGDLARTLEGGHSRPRIIHATDATGRAIHIALLNALRDHPRITLLTAHMAAMLVRTADATACAGALFWVESEARWRLVMAGATVLATGGLAALYARTTNPPGTLGDGMAMAHALGATLADLEFVQFHPTAFAAPNAPAFLISEAVRGAGARLLNDEGDAFMARYAPRWRDLAPRDVVARAIFTEMQRRGLPHVWLDLASVMPPERIRERFPTITETCATYGVDITREPIPVAPAAHYTCGGVVADAWGRTNVPHLYAVGEVACTGLHGANRLASTSLLEGVVWGARVAHHLTQERPRPPAHLHIPEMPHGTSPSTHEAETLLEHIHALMWQHVGLVRTSAGLHHAVETFARLRKEAASMYHESHPSLATIRTWHAATAAFLVAHAALNNTQSVGCHIRLESEEMEVAWHKEVPTTPTPQPKSVGVQS